MTPKKNPFFFKYIGTYLECSFLEVINVYKLKENTLTTAKHGAAYTLQGCIRYRR